MLRTRARDPAAVLVPAIILLLAAAVMAAAETEETSLPMLPMEVYFTAAELARIAGYGEEPVSSVSVSGQLACELCLRPGSRLLTLEMPGAKVAVSCETEGTPGNKLAFATTDEYGNFTIDLPPQLHATPDLEKACTVRVLQLPAESCCRLRHRTGDAYRLSLSSAQDGVRAYTAGVIRLSRQRYAVRSLCGCGGAHVSKKMNSKLKPKPYRTRIDGGIHAKRRVQVFMDF